MRIPTIKDLPDPPAGRAGWPWTEGCEPLGEYMADGTPWPRVSIVTPSFNQGQFLEETLRSVLLQGYPNLELIVIDGGSTDDSVEIIRRYEPWISYWVSERDRGQSHAINKGLALVTGEWFNWINSDDLLLPHALRTLAEISRMVSYAAWISGGRAEINEHGAFVEVCMPWRTDPTVIGLGIIDLPQDATFVRTDFLRRCGTGVSEEYVNVFDTLLHYQLVERERPVLTSALFSAMRWHVQQKTQNAERRGAEFRTAILPYLRRLPLTQRIWYRLLRTRWEGTVRAMLRVAIARDMIGYARGWQAVVFNRGTCAFELLPARKVLFGG